jgi:DNA polymerase-3 subunit alpha
MYRSQSRGQHLPKVLIYGAGNAGRQLAMAMASNHSMRVAGFLDDDDRLRGEKETLGLYLTGHPVARYREELRRLTGSTLQQLEATLESRPDRNVRRIRQESVRIAGLVVGVRQRNSQNGRMAIVTLDDQTGRAEIVLYSEAFREHQARLVPDALLVAEGPVNLDDFAGGVRMRAQRVLTLDEARREWGRVLDVSLEGVRPEHIQSLHRAIAEHDPGACRLRMRYRRGTTVAELRLPEQWQVQPDEQLLRRLHEILGPESRVTLLYGTS